MPGKRFDELRKCRKGKTTKRASRGKNCAQALSLDLTLLIAAVRGACSRFLSGSSCEEFLDNALSPVVLLNCGDDRVGRASRLPRSAKPTTDLRSRSRSRARWAGETPALR